MRGVYAITNKANGKMYVGSARNIEVRWHAHRNMLRAGKHHSFYLQRAWNKYGEDGFILQVLERVEKDGDLRAAEQRWLDFLGSSSGGDSGYNVHPVAAGGQLPGWTPPPESLAKQRDGRRRGEGNIKARLNEAQVKEICARYAAGESIRKIAPVYDVHTTTIALIVQGKTWKHVDAPRYKHLFEATGKSHRSDKLAASDVEAIRARLTRGDKGIGKQIADVAREYGVSRQTIENIVYGRRRTLDSTL